MRFEKILLLAIVLTAVLTTGGCGYRLATKRGNAGAGRTIAVPTFTNVTTNYRVEQRVSEALRRELIQRTRFKVVSGETGDVLISGDVLGYGAFPTTITAGKASSYTISLTMRVVVKDTHTGEILFQNPAWTFRENFELAPNSAEFVPEEPAAVDRVSSSFASSLVATLLAVKP
jgi:hypothetical protein